MTVESSLSKVVFNGNGVTTEFPFTFKVWDVSEIAVTMANPQGYAEDVTAAAVITLDEDSGGAVTYLHEGAPLPEGWRLAITRNMPFLQRVDLVSATRFDPQVMEDALDQACAERQELREQLARAVIMPPTSETTPEEVVQSVYDARDAAAASATAASGSASEASGSAALAQAWAESPTPPDAGDADSKSARTWAGLAADSADDAAASESNATGSADRAQAWAESPAPPDPEDPDSKSAKTWAAIAADTVPIATPTLAGKVKPDGATIEVAQDGGISVPAATTATRGTARLATPAEVQAGAAAAGSVTPAVVNVEDIGLKADIDCSNVTATAFNNIVSAFTDDNADDVAAAHNCIYRGKDLTNVYTLAELSAKLAAGDFSDIYIGDYITYPYTHDGGTKNVNFRFGHFNYWKYMGNTESVLTVNHILMVPDTPLYDSQMQTSNTTAGGVPASIVWKALQAETYNEVNAATCMNGHVVTHRDMIPDSVNNSAASDWGAGFTGSTIYTTTVWRDVKLGLMKEPMVYGGKVVSSSGYDIGCGKSQIALFRLDSTWITGRAARYDWWLGAVSTSMVFALAGGNGSVADGGASGSYGVRPYFLFA